MTPEQRLILEMADVLAIRLECSKCGAAVVMKPTDWRESPLECPGCKGFWELPHVVEQSFSAIQHLGTGLRMLLDQAQSAAKAGATLPYRVRFEIRDPASSWYVGSASS
jgi:hypothetical protein